MEHERGPHWYEVIGAFIINFGAVETCSYQWILKLGGKTALNNSIGPLLGQRIKLLLELISKSNLSPEQKKHFSALWIEISELAKTRNVIAHGPLVSHTKAGKMQMGILDFKQMKNAGPNPPFTPLLFTDILRAGSRTAKILEEIVEPP